MKRKIIILAALFLAGAAFLFFDITGSKKNHGKEFSTPVFEVSDAVSGKKLSSSNLKDKIIFVHFWASW